MKENIILLCSILQTIVAIAALLIALNLSSNEIKYTNPPPNNEEVSDLIIIA